MRRALAVTACLLGSVVLASCGPQGPVEEGGEPGRPLEIVNALPSPADLRGAPGERAGPDALARAFTGESDPELGATIDARAPEAAAARTWTSPSGGTLTVVVSVWPSHLIATGVGSDLAAMLVADGGAAWTPRAVPAARGARRDRPPEARIGLSEGPNALYVRATGDVGDDVAVRAMQRLRVVLEGQTG